MQYQLSSRSPFTCKDGYIFVLAEERRPQRPRQACRPAWNITLYCKQWIQGVRGSTMSTYQCRFSYCVTCSPAAGKALMASRIISILMITGIAGAVILSLWKIYLSLVASDLAGILLWAVLLLVLPMAIALAALFVHKLIAKSVSDSGISTPHGP
jgi:hypothetical protein